MTRHERRIFNFAGVGTYVINATRHPAGTVFTNRNGVGALTWQLPKPTLALTGWWCRILAQNNNGIAVATGTPDTALALNDLAADNLALVTAGLIAGGVIEAVCDGQQWWLTGKAIGNTYTVAT